jgi:hypothetical protein
MTNTGGPPDDHTIANAAELWRRIFPDWWIPDYNTGTRRLSTAAFQDAPDRTPMSVAIAAECAGPEELLSDYDGYGLAAFTAGSARACRQGVVRAPTKELPAHAHVVGKKTTGVKKCLREAADVRIEPLT